MYYTVTQYAKAGKHSNIGPAALFLQSVSLAWSPMPVALTFFSFLSFFVFLDLNELCITVLHYLSISVCVLACTKPDICFCLNLYLYTIQYIYACT